MVESDIDLEVKTDYENLLEVNSSTNKPLIHFLKKCYSRPVSASLKASEWSLLMQKWMSALFNANINVTK